MEKVWMSWARRNAQGGLGEEMDYVVARWVSLRVRVTVCKVGFVQLEEKW